jgi:alkanesulfonate monooxygenase SsuD/methylene tetrahydromethanopterin reductase-like flavin-dependent oxidoreductase (luciferase family)
VGAGFPFPETERQFEAVGVPYRGRVTRMRETIEAIRMLWANPGERVSYSGAHVRLDEVALQPAPWREGGPPVWLAGTGEAAERRVGEIADGWLPYPPTPELYAEGWARVRAAAEAASRPQLPAPGLYATVALDSSPERARERLKVNIERYYSLPVGLVGQVQAMYAGTPQGLTSWLASYIDAGARHIVLRVSDENAERGLETAGEALELLRGKSTTTKEAR